MANILGVKQICDYDIFGNVITKYQRSLCRINKYQKITLVNDEG